MKPISTIIVDFIDTTMSIKNLKVYCSDHGKIFVLDEEFDTLFKFDLIFSDTDFSCQILVRSNDLSLYLAGRLQIDFCLE